MEEDCGCEVEEELKEKEFILPEEDTETLGEEIFENDDIFDRVKRYYQNFNRQEEDEEDLLLEKLVDKSEPKEITYINELLELNDSFQNVRESRSLYFLEDKAPLVEEKRITTLREEDSLNTEKEKKIKYIKDYLKKLKDGT